MGECTQIWPNPARHTQYWFQISKQKTEAMQKEEKQKIDELLNEYKRSLNTSDAKLAQSLYTKDGIFMPTEAPSGIGSENILKSYEYVFSQIQLNGKLTIWLGANLWSF